MGPQSPYLSNSGTKKKGVSTDFGNKVKCRHAETQPVAIVQP
jgi:hypothetical protein